MNLSDKINKLNFKNQSSVGWNDPWHTPLAVCVFRWACNGGLLSLFQLYDPLIPAADDLPHAYNKIKGFTAIETRVELGAVTQPPCVVDQHTCPLRTQLSIYFRFDFYLELCWGVISLLSSRILFIRTVV